MMKKFIFTSIFLILEIYLLFNSKEIIYSFNKTLNAILSLYRPSNFSKNCHFDINFYKGEITFDE